jgi:hypothetical protein
MLVVACFMVSNYSISKSIDKMVSTPIETQVQSISVPLKDYVLVVMKQSGYIINKATLKTIRLEQETIHKITKAKRLTNKGNLLILKNRNARQFALVDVSRFFVEQENTSKGVWDVNYSLILLVIVSVLSIVVFLLRKRSKVFVKSKSRKVEHYLYQRIVASENCNLTIQELDMLLEIDKLSSDSRKLKRHRLINELNSHYPGIIERVKDLSDRRRNIYKIHTNR